jgi:ubiquinone/menaquinone biosynthesis C-methylase UbiE
VDNRELTPPYFRPLVHLIRPFPNFDLFFAKRLRRRAVEALQLAPGDRVLDVGCGLGGSFPFLLNAVGTSGEVVGVEISPEVATNARKRVETNGWNNVAVVEGDAKTVPLQGRFDGILMLAAPDAYAAPQAVEHLLRYTRENARVVAFGAKLSRRPGSRLLNWIVRSLMKLSFASTPQLTYEPWSLLETRLADFHSREYALGCMFLAWGRMPSAAGGAGRRV